MHSMGTLRRTAVLALFVAAACDGGATSPAGPGETVSMVAFTAVSQNAVVGSPAPVPPAVHLLDNYGRGVAGVEVRFAVTEGNGSVAPSSTTDGRGIAVAQEWVMGPAVQENAITASFPGMAPVVFRAVTAPGAPAALEKAGGDGQSAAVATALADSIAVRVVDRFGNAVSGAEVTFTASAGVLSATRVSTGADGHARVSLVLPNQAGSVQVTAGVGGVVSQPFTFTAMAGPAVALQKAGGDGQSATVGTAPADPIGVRVVDPFGNGVPGVEVTFTTSSGVLSATRMSTDADGHARVSLVLPTRPGAVQVVAGAGGLASLSFGVTATAGLPEALEKVGGDGQSGTVGTSLADPIAVRVVDGFGNALPGTEVSFTASSGTLSAGRVSTDANGFARVSLVLPTRPGIVQVVAGVGSLAGQSFAVTATAGPPAALQKAGGDGQSARVGTSPADSLVLRVVDSFGNPLPGREVTFEVWLGGTLSATRAVTNAHGDARVNLLLPTRSGTVHVYAALGSLARQTFTITATPGPAVALSKGFGDHGLATTGTATVYPPSLQVIDSYGNGVPGVAVTFTPAPGSGVVTGGSTVSNPGGHAQVVRWVLGEPGPNQLNAVAAGVPPVTFTATSLPPCGGFTHTLFTTLYGGLLEGRCSFNGRHAELYSVTVAAEQCVEFYVHSAKRFTPHLYLLDSAGTVRAETPGFGGLDYAYLTVHLPVGSYTLVVTAPGELWSRYISFVLDSYPVPDEFLGSCDSLSTQRATSTQRGTR